MCLFLKQGEGCNFRPKQGGGDIEKNVKQAAKQEQ